MNITMFGFGSVGQKLAALLNDAGHQVSVAVRNTTTVTTPFDQVSFEQGAKSADIVLLAIPFTAAEKLLVPLAEMLANKVVVDVTNPLNDDWSPLLLGEQNSAGELIATYLPKSHVVKAFNTIFADVMSVEKHDRNGAKITAFIASEHQQAAETVAGLATQMGLASVMTGPLKTARYLEAMAHLNIQIALGQQGGTDAAFVYHQQ